MKAPEQCATLKQQAQAAKKAVWQQKLGSAKRKEAHKKSVEAQKRFKSCKKDHGKAGAILYARGLARAAQDAGVRFGLKPGFNKKAGLFRVDNAVAKQFGVKKAKDATPKAQAFAKKNDLAEAAKYAAIIEGLNDAKKGATGGFIAAQVGAAIMDVVGSFVTAGGYATIAPAIHAGLSAGQKITITALNNDIARNEEMYAAAIANRQAKIDQKKLAAEAAALEKQAAELEALDKKTPDEPPPPPVPWYRTKPVLAAGGAIAVLGIFAAVQATRRT